MVTELTFEEATKDSSLFPDQYPHNGSPQKYYNLYENSFSAKVDEAKIVEVNNAPDDQYRWMTENAYISNPYIGEGRNSELTDRYSKKRVGDETDTSPFLDTSNQKYISTREYITNMKLLINYLK